MPVIETIGLTKYYGQARGIIDVNLRVEEGEIFGFIGPNGAGKSTTIRTLLNFIFPTSGSAKIFGLDVVQDSVRIKQQIGYLPAEVGYYDDMTVKDLFTYAAGFYANNYLANAYELADIFELDVNRPIHALSLGNRKKVGIVLAMFHQPKLLIFDEPTSGLDPLMQRRFFEVLEQVNAQGTTIFFSSHVLSEVQRLCHRVAIIKEGRILQVGKMDDLRHKYFRNVRVEFKQGTMPKIDLPGILHSYQENGSWNMLYNGDINDLLAVLAQYQLTNLWLEEPSLEEIFLHYYEKEGV
ncbi:MAG: ABC transporter ATP-binding protein [Firmicutes bacterium]|nr:ABC transporter ATP-binding protein [Bacillota bacterium]